MLAAQTEPPTPDTSATILDDSMTTETPGLTNIETSTMTASSEMEKEVVATSKGEGEFSMQCDQKKLPNVYKSCTKMFSLEK